MVDIANPKAPACPNRILGVMIPTPLRDVVSQDVRPRRPGRPTEVEFRGVRALVQDRELTLSRLRGSHRSWNRPPSSPNPRPLPDGDPGHEDSRTRAADADPGQRSQAEAVAAAGFSRPSRLAARHGRPLRVLDGDRLLRHARAEGSRHLDRGQPVLPQPPTSGCRSRSSAFFRSTRRIAGQQLGRSRPPAAGRSARNTARADRLNLHHPADRPTPAPDFKLVVREEGGRRHPPLRRRSS